MIAVLQRVASAAVIADGVPSGAIGKGLFVLLGVAEGDTDADAVRLAAKVAKCRIFSDAEDKQNLSVTDVGGAALVVSNFTLLADYHHGNRPSYFGAAAPAEAERLYLLFVGQLRREVADVQTGVFGAHMDIDLRADGPITLVMDSNVLKPAGEKKP